MEFLRSQTGNLVGVLSFLTVAGDGLAMVLLALLVFGHKTKWARWIQKYGLACMLVLALVATGGSLFFSEIAGWVPCKECWLQRIFMYPQAVLLAVAVWRRDRGVAAYVLALCLIGVVFSASQYYQQVFAVLQSSSAHACDASGISCSSTQIDFAYGYVTIPMMALTAFVLNAILSVFVLREKK
jgi:disulfide bond formation protein DsbB